MLEFQLFASESLEEAERTQGGAEGLTSLPDGYQRREVNKIILATQNEVHGPTALASSGRLLEE